MNNTITALFTISFFKNSVVHERALELYRNLMKFKPTRYEIDGFRPGRIKKAVFFEELSNLDSIEKYSVFQATRISSTYDFIWYKIYHSTGIIEIYGGIQSEQYNIFEEVKRLIYVFSAENTILSASLKFSAERHYNDLTDIRFVRKYHPEMTNIKTIGNRTHPSADPEQFAAHTHNYDGIWFGCCYEMWFGKDYDKYIPLEKIKTFKECKLNETLNNDTVHIILYDSPDEFSTEKSVERAWAFRKHTDCDSAADVWKKRVNELAHKAGHFTYEIEEGKFPHGGIRLLKTYLDENGNHVNKCDAVKVHIYEGGTDGKPVFEEIVELKR